MEKESSFFRNTNNARPDVEAVAPQPERKTRKRTSKEIKSELSPEQIAALADKTAEELNIMETIPNFQGMKKEIKLGIAVRKVLGISRDQVLDEKEKADKKAILGELGRRGAEKTNYKKNEGGINKKPEKISKVTTLKKYEPVPRETMMEQAQKLQKDEEMRSGQTYRDSDIET